jgi:hypothetical protein
MFLRKITASFLVIVFVVLAVPIFLIYGVSRTYLNTDFYRRDELVQGGYDYALDKTVTVLRSDSKYFNGYFTADELRTQIGNVFTKKIFANVLADFAAQVDQYEKDPRKPVNLSLQTLRSNLLTVANNLTYQIYQKLPTCSDAGMLKINEDQAPDCVPQNLPYEEVMQNVSSNFEDAIYNNVPEELGNIDKAVPLAMLVKIESYRNLSFILLLGILALIVIIVYGKISTILAYIGTGFLMGGAVGYGFSFALTSSLSSIQGDLADPRSQEFLLFLLNFLISEVQRMSILFFVVGLAVFLIRFVLKRTVEEDQKGVIRT